MSNFTPSVFRLNSRILCQIYGFQLTPKLISKQNIFNYNVRYVSSPSQKGNHRPNTLEKYMLVWRKKYPSVAEVPSTVSNDVMEKTRNWVRIKVNIYLCILTAVACVILIYSSKQRAKRGETLSKIGAKFHEDAKKE